MNYRIIFQIYLRIDEAAYRHLPKLVTQLIKRKDNTVMKRSVRPQRLSAALRFVTTDRTYVERI